MQALSLEEVQTVSVTHVTAIAPRPTTAGEYNVIVTEGSIITQDQLITENRLLTDVVRNLWNSYQYQQEYELFLLGTRSEAEFLAASERYATSFQSMPTQSLIFASSLLLTILDVSLTSRDLSVLLNVDPFDIEQSLRSSANSGAVMIVQWDVHGEQR